jgi:hypothetical protein
VQRKKWGSSRQKSRCCAGTDRAAGRRAGNAKELEENARRRANYAEETVEEELQKANSHERTLLKRIQQDILNTNIKLDKALQLWKISEVKSSHQSKLLNRKN